jgi:hypothetical protein
MKDSPLDSKARQDTKLEAQGAEFLVLGSLLVEGISCYKAYVNFPGYDLVAFDPDRRRTARIQVKSRWATDYDKSFFIRNFDCDFVVHVALDRGYRFRKRTKPGPGIGDPSFYVFPVEIVKQAQIMGHKWGKVRMANIPECQRYKSNWSLIVAFLHAE